MCETVAWCRSVQGSVAANDVEAPDDAMASDADGNAITDDRQRTRITVYAAQVPEDHPALSLRDGASVEPPHDLTRTT